MRPVCVVRAACARFGNSLKWVRRQSAIGANLKTLVLIDAQNGFVTDTHAQNVVNRIWDSLDRGVFDTVIATKFLNKNESVYEKAFDWHGMKAGKDCAVCPELAGYVDVSVTKTTYDCVNDIFLDALRFGNVGVLPEEVYVAGCDTDVCVLLSAAHLFEIGIRPIVLRDLTWSSGGKKSHKAGLRALSRIVGPQNIMRSTMIDER